MNETKKAVNEETYEYVKSPYQILKGMGIKSWFHSPDSFVKIEEFETGEAFLHSPLIGYPTRLSNWK